MVVGIADTERQSERDMEIERETVALLSLNGSLLKLRLALQPSVNNSSTMVPRLGARERVFVLPAKTPGSALSSASGRSARS